MQSGKPWPLVPAEVHPGLLELTADIGLAGRRSFLALCTLIFAGLFATIRVDPHHDGYIFKPAFDVAHGKVLYRDTYTQYGALSIMLPALLLRLVGDYLLAVKLLVALVYAIIAFYHGCCGAGYFLVGSLP